MLHIDLDVHIHLIYSTNNCRLEKELKNNNSKHVAINQLFFLLQFTIKEEP